MAAFPVLGAGLGFLGWRWIAGYCAVAVLADQWTRRRGVTLTPQVAIVHGRGGAGRRIAWSRILAITVEKDIAGRSVLLWTDRGTRVRLGAPSAWHGSRGFEATVEVIDRWWVAHRGPYWRPPA